jgi:hypothetical protein
LYPVWAAHNIAYLYQIAEKDTLVNRLTYHACWALRGPLGTFFL